jgi:hypothetical protein
MVVVVHTAVLTAPALAFAQAPQPVPCNQTRVPYDAAGDHPASSATAPPGTRALVAPAGSDVIYLKNGGVLRGTIIDATPDAQARIQLATGEIATVPWSEIARFEHGATLSTAPSPAPPPTARAEPAPKAAPAGPMVHIDSPSTVELQYKGEGENESWRTVCSSPCDRRLPAEGRYRIGGDSARPSRTFILPEGTGTVSLAVNPSSHGWFNVGVVLTAVGAPTMVIGFIMGLYVASLCTSGDCSVTGQDVATGGWTAFGLGAAGLVVGLIAIVVHARTGVDVQSGAAKEGAAGSPWMQVATFRDGREPAPESRAAPAVGGTVFKLSF